MINIINPIALYALSFIGALGLIWSFKYSYNKTLQNIAPINNFRQSLILIIFTNILVLIYIFIHAIFISKMLIEPGFLERSDGSATGFFWTDNLDGWKQIELDKYDFYKVIKEFIFISFNIIIFLFSLFLRKNSNIKLYAKLNSKPNFIFTYMLIVLSVLLTIITLSVLLLAIDEYVIWDVVA